MPAVLSGLTAAGTGMPARQPIWPTVMIYAVFAGVWIILSDVAVRRLVMDVELHEHVDLIKELVFVLVTSVLLFLLISRLLQSQLEADARASAAAQGRDNARVLLQTLAEKSPDGIVVKDRSGRYLLFNQSAERITGISASAALGATVDELYPAPEAAMVRANDDRVMAQDRSETFEESFDAPGGRATVVVTKNPLHDAAGNVIGVFGISRDVTAEVAAREQLRESERRYRTLFDANPLPMCVYEVPSLRILAINEAAVEHYGFSRDEFLAMTIAEVHAPEERPRLEQAMAEARRTAPDHVRHVGMWIHRRKDGSRIEVEMTVDNVTFDGVPARLALANDVTERNRTEKALQKSELRYRLAAAAGDVWDWDIATGDASFGPAFWRLLGVTLPPPSSEAMARFTSLMHPEDTPRCRHAMREHLARRAPYDIEYRSRHADGEWRWFQTRGQAVWNAAGRATYMAGTTFEVTDRRRAQDALNEAEAYRRRLFEQMGDGVLLVHRDSRLLDVNPQALEMLGYTRTELLQLRRHDLLADFEHHRLTDKIPGVLSGKVHIAEWEHVRKNGTHFPAEVSARALDENRYVTVIRDITARRAAEKALLTYQLELSDLAHRLLTQEKVTTQRIAQALHDNLGQTLAVARLMLDAAVARAGDALPKPLAGECGRLGTVLDTAVQQVRQVLADLRPPMLEEHGLAAALDNEIRGNPGASGGADILLETADRALGKRWPADIEYGTFMVTREAIANARQHARASLIRVVLDGEDRWLTVEVIDDGRGIPAPMVEGRPGHLGIVGMRERAVGIGARFSVARRPEGGTVVSLRWYGMPS